VTSSKLVNAATVFGTGFLGKAVGVTFEGAAGAERIVVDQLYAATLQLAVSGAHRPLRYHGGFMLPRPALAFALLSLCACKPSVESHMKAIIGAVLIDGQGGPPVSNSVVVVAEDRIRAAGPSSVVPIPAEADKIDGSGKCLVPGLVDVYTGPQTATDFTAGHPASPEEARARVADLAKNGAPTIQLWKLAPAVSDAVMEAARGAGISVTGHISTLEEAEFLVKSGVSGLVGMICDTEKLDPDFLARLRDLRIFFAPWFAQGVANGAPVCGPAARNTLRLYQAGVPMALASFQGDLVRAAEFLADAGVPPLDVIVAATRNGAVAIHQDQERGTIQAGKRADLLLLSANPGEDIRNLRKVAWKLTWIP
jgi:imidazolonepropionase-like amidohydrolase